MQPLSFQPPKHDVETVPIEVHNKVVEDLEGALEELQRARQKIAHLIRENEELKSK